jgi:septal ring factor EnvC (AmiA/AmiB activator)
LILSCSLWLSASADQAQGDETKELELLRARIHNLQAKLTNSRQERDTLFAALKRVEQAISHSTQQLVKLDQRLTNRSNHLQDLTTEYNRLQANRSYQRETFAKQIRNAYIASHQETLQLLLSQQDLAKLGQALTYFNYFHRSQSQRIVQISQALETIEKLRAAMRDEQMSLSRLRAQIAQKREHLKSNYQTRSQVLAQLEREIQKKDAQLQIMRESEQTLEQIVASISILLLDIPADAFNIQPFQSLRGNLLWPCQGPVLQHFGALRTGGKYQSQGIMIAAEQGDPVRAVFYGRVAFANWLRSYGLLLIVDHGDGYMTLYGHNQSLFREVGDWVNTGEIVAQAGNSGGHQQVGVYFELRYQGEPTNPLSWLMKPS